MITVKELLTMKILLIEDDLQICEVIEKYFGNRDTLVVSVHSGSAALDTIYNSIGEYSLVLLDIMLPEADGFTICREIRRNSDIPLIFITARGREEDILHGYDLGCDDYIVKPVLLSALYAKCTAMIKRAEGHGGNVLECGAIKLDKRRLTCYVDGTEVELPPKSFAILCYLMEHEGWTVDRETLLNRVWGSDYFGVDRVVDNHIKKLRKALGTAGKQIHTAVGKGYKLTNS